MSDNKLINAKLLILKEYGDLIWRDADMKEEDLCKELCEKYWEELWPFITAGVRLLHDMFNV